MARVRLRVRTASGRAVQRRRGLAAGHTQGVATRIGIDLVRVRETQQLRAAGFVTLGIVGHDRAPAGGHRGVLLEGLLVHIAVGVGRRRFAATIAAQPGRVEDARHISVVGQAHEVAQLMGKCAGIDTGRGKRIGRGGLGGRQDVVGDAGVANDNQHDDVCGHLVAGGVDLVHMAVGRILETIDIFSCRTFGRVLHLLHRCERDALVHPARPIGQVGLRRHEVDLGLDRGGPASVVPGGRRVENRHVDHRLRFRRADQPAEGDRG